MELDNKLTFQRLWRKKLTRLNQSSTGTRSHSLLVLALPGPTDLSCPSSFVCNLIVIDWTFFDETIINIVNFFIKKLQFNRQVHVVTNCFMSLTLFEYSFQCDNYQLSKKFNFYGSSESPPSENFQFFPHLKVVLTDVGDKIFCYGV